MGFFSLNRITGHPVNSSQFNELPHPVATTQGQAGKNGNSPRASCAEQGVKVQHTAHCLFSSEAFSSKSWFAGILATVESLDPPAACLQPHCGAVFRV